MKKFETVYAFVIGICDFCAYWYVRLFPPLAFGLAIFFAICAEHGVKQTTTTSDLTAVLAIVIIVTLMSALWVILHLLEKLSESRPPRHYRKVNKK